MSICAHYMYHKNSQYIDWFLNLKHSVNQKLLNTQRIADLQTKIMQPTVWVKL